MSIKLNDILNFSQEELENTRIKFNLMFAGNWNPIEIFKNKDEKVLLEGQYWNSEKETLKKGKQLLVLSVLKMICGCFFI